MFRFLLIAVLGIGLSACATVTRGTTEALVITSEPSGADVSLSNGMQCTTPCTLTLPRRSTVQVSFTRDGYEPLQTQVTHTTAGGGAAGMAGNVLVGGLIGVAVDASSGATQDLVPNPLHVRMIPESVTASRSPDGTVQSTERCQTTANARTGIYETRCYSDAESSMVSADADNAMAEEGDPNEVVCQTEDGEDGIPRTTCRTRAEWQGI